MIGDEAAKNYCKSESR